MTFYQTYQQASVLPFTDIFASRTSEDIQGVLNKTSLDESDFLTLLSPAAEPFLKDMAQKAQQITVKQFGKEMQLFAPLYLSDHCVNQCVYCSFSIGNQFPRTQLSLPEIEMEAKAIAETGIRHLLLVTGESRTHASMEYLKACAETLKPYFSSISIEVQPLKTEEYRELARAGVTGLTVYQEVYNEAIYADIHLKGPKRNYLNRLDTPERGCQAGMQSVNLGALLGLDDWRKEMFFAGIHADYLGRRYPETNIGLGFPRIRPHLGDFQPRIDVTDENLVHAMLAVRLFLPKASIVLSTRERMEFRDELIHFGVTKMSAASSTAVGGYATEGNRHSQFEISDERSVNEIVKMLHENGYRVNVS